MAHTHKLAGVGGASSTSKTLDAGIRRLSKGDAAMIMKLNNQVQPEVFSKPIPTALSLSLSLALSRSPSPLSNPSFTSFRIIIRITTILYPGRTGEKGVCEGTQKHHQQQQQQDPCLSETAVPNTLPVRDAIRSHSDPLSDHLATT